MENKKQTVEDFITPEVLETCTTVEKEKLNRVYTTVTARIKKQGAEPVPSFGGTWEIDHEHFLNLIAYDQLDNFSIMLNERVDDQTMSTVFITPDQFEFGEVYIMLPENLKLMTNIQKALRDIKEHHTVFCDMQPPVDTDSDD